MWNMKGAVAFFGKTWYAPVIIQERVVSVKIRYISVLMALVLLLGGCGGETASAPAEQPSEAPPAAFGVEAPAQSPEQMAEVTMAPPEKPEEVPDVPETPPAEAVPEEAPAAEKDLTALAVQSVVLCDYREMLPYAHGEPVLFWRAMAYLVDAVGLESGFVTVTEEGTELGLPHAEMFVQALFAGYDEDYPAVTEENPFVYTKPGEEFECLVFSVVPYEELDISVSQPERQEDGTFAAVAEVYDSGELAATYRATLVESGYEGGGNLFPLSVTDLRAE